jgi:hypothetical protein
MALGSSHSASIGLQSGSSPGKTRRVECTHDFQCEYLHYYPKVDMLTVVQRRITGLSRKVIEVLHLEPLLQKAKKSESGGEDET